MRSTCRVRGWVDGGGGGRDWRIAEKRKKWVRSGEQLIRSRGFVPVAIETSPGYTPVRDVVWLRVKYRDDLFVHPLNPRLLFEMLTCKKIPQNTI